MMKRLSVMGLTCVVAACAQPSAELPTLPDGMLSLRPQYNGQFEVVWDNAVSEVARGHDAGVASELYLVATDEIGDHGAVDLLSRRLVQSGWRLEREWERRDRFVLKEYANGDVRFGLMRFDEDFAFEAADGMSRYRPVVLYVSPPAELPNGAPLDSALLWSVPAD